jgi:transposase
MKWFNELPPVYLHRAPVDFRKAVNGLSVIVEQEMGLSPYVEGLFIFCNRNRDRIKILHWDKTGFVLWYKRLEQAKFKWPGVTDQTVMNISDLALSNLLNGFTSVRKN